MWRLLTSDEKLDRDRDRYDVDESRGDRRPLQSHQSASGLTLANSRSSSTSALITGSSTSCERLKFLRRLLPGMASSEKEFRDWYSNIILRFDFRNASDYQSWLEILECRNRSRATATSVIPNRMPPAEKQSPSWPSLTAGGFLFQPEARLFIEHLTTRLRSKRSATCPAGMASKMTGNARTSISF